MKYLTLLIGLFGLTAFPATQPFAANSSLILSAQTLRFFYFAPVDPFTVPGSTMVVTQDGNALVVEIAENARPKPLRFVIDVHSAHSGAVQRLMTGLAKVKSGFVGIKVGMGCFQTRAIVNYTGERFRLREDSFRKLGGSRELPAVGPEGIHFMDEAVHCP